MDSKIAAGPYRATKLWNETIELFRARMPLKKHRLHFRTYDSCFAASEGVDWLHKFLRSNPNFGSEVTRYQTVQLLKKFLKNHVIEDIKGRWGKEDFEDNNRLYRFPPSSPLKPYPKKASHLVCDVHPKFPNWSDYDIPTSGPVPVRPIILNSYLWHKRHSIAIGEVSECRIIHRKEVSQATVEEIWKSMTLAYLQKILGLDSLEGVLDSKLLNPKHIIYNVHHINKQGVVILENKLEELPHWVLSAMKCLANWPNGSDLNRPMYPGFERDVFKTIADYFQKTKQPLLTFEFYELFINILGLLQQTQDGIEALQVCCLLVPPENRRKLQLLMRMIARIAQNVEMPPLHDAVANRMLMIQTFSRCILCSEDEVDLDELLATRLVSFMMDHYQDILRAPDHLQSAVEEHLAHLRRVQIKYAGADADATVASYTTSCQFTTEDCKEQRSSQAAVVTLLEEIIMNKTISVKEKKKKLKQFQKSYPDIYKTRFPTAESEAMVFPEKSRLKPQFMFFTMKKSFQPFNRTRSFRM
ncbi:DEP domain-containing protein 1B-like isoform X1 [Chiloscyllium plagiosum]|uniref:DEP domain-containing protein 1B-like isoform X1 n=1 Tax=Chiloscyllium plagiosum TaxID=36176 RepID=UPI001CB835EB|nr:DEP domain-containing protein 1B-like isoform X1 [Chiloscyllium plagiosum]XP_043545249.1 DEP domain-containing protein 1B-like isoform X1 [Chiloscyllium plagiosum]